MRIIQACEVCGGEAYSGNLACRRCRLDRRSVVRFCEYRDCLRPAVELSNRLPLCAVHGRRAERVLADQVRDRDDVVNGRVWSKVLHEWGHIRC